MRNEFSTLFQPVEHIIFFKPGIITIVAFLSILKQLVEMFSHRGRNTSVFHKLPMKNRAKMSVSAGRDPSRYQQCRNGIETCVIQTIDRGMGMAVIQ